MKIGSKILKKLDHFGCPGGHSGVFSASWVHCAVQKAVRSVSGAVSGGSWALLGVVLGRPGRQLGAKMAPKRAPEADKNVLEN